MDTGERLAAYLSGDLDPDERTALEAELAGDPRLRARLDRIRASDEALASLDDPELPEGFSDRLRARLAPELDAVLGDELATRRARRGAPRWLPAVGAAAVLALVVAGGISLGGGGMGADDGDTAATLEAGGGEADAGMADGAPEAMSVPAAGPVVVDRDRSLSLEDLATLAEDPDVQAAIADDALQGDPAGTAQAYASALGASLTSLEEAEAAGTDGGADETTMDAEMFDDITASRSAASVFTLGEVSDDDRAAVAACVDVLFQDAAFPVVPVLAELATDEDGAPVIVYVALSPDEEGRYRGVEVWMVDRDTCEVRDVVLTDPQDVERTAP